MGCLFWSDFDPSLAQNTNSANEEFRIQWEQKMVLYLIQFRKFINYFVEQSLINGLWGHYQHDVIAMASIYLARFEMKSIHQVRWKRKQQQETIQI